jgi:hypothetical protein
MLVVFIADMLSESVDAPWWLYLLLFLFDGTLIKIKYSR